MEAPVIVLDVILDAEIHSVEADDPPSGFGRSETDIQAGQAVMGDVQSPILPDAYPRTPPESHHSVVGLVIRRPETHGASFGTVPSHWKPIQALPVP